LGDHGQKEPFFFQVQLLRRAQEAGLSGLESKLESGWQWMPLDPVGKPSGLWQAVDVPSAWQRYPGGWNHCGRAKYRFELPPPVDPGASRRLRFEGVFYSCRVFYSGSLVGKHEGGWDPFWVDLPESEQGGTIEVEVEGVGPALPKEEITSGFLPDCGVLWSGIWKDVYLVEGASVVLKGAAVRWAHSRRTLGIKPLFSMSRGKKPAKVSAELITGGGRVEAASHAEQGGTLPGLEIPCPRLWRLSDPYLYTLRVQGEDREGRVDQWEKKIGLRTLAARKGALFLNDEPILLRGALSWGCDPATITPPGDEKSLASEIRGLKASGFNMIKHCLYVPQDICFRLGDELGMLQWLEMPMWLPSGSKPFRRRALEEFPRIAEAFQHHPSLVLYSLGCELGKKTEKHFLGKLFRSVSRRVAGALICENSGSGECYGAQESGLSHFHDYHFYCEPMNLAGLMGLFGAPWRPLKPWIFGEFCDSDCVRDNREIRAAFDDKALWWLEKDPKKNPLFPDRSRVQKELGWVFQDERLKSAGLGGQVARLVKASKLHSMAHRKTTIETARRYPRTAGYVVTGLRDTPITVSGLFDDLGRLRFDARAYAGFNSDTVLLLLPLPERIWVNGGDRCSGHDIHHHFSSSVFKAVVAVSHFGCTTNPAPDLRWRLTSGKDRVVRKGSVRITAKPLRGVCLLGELAIELPAVVEPARFELTLSLELDGNTVTGTWPVWVHPSGLKEAAESIHLHDPGGELDSFTGLNGSEDAGVWLSPDLDAHVMNRLERGGALILAQAGSRPLAVEKHPFWREAVHLAGSHPLAELFPFQDGGGEEMLSLSTDRFFSTDSGGSLFERMIPVLTRLDTRLFNISYSLVELAGKPGRCIATTLNLAGGMGDQPLGLDKNRAGTALLGAICYELMDVSMS